ncbi:MAG: SH3 domain-containing protein [Chloroflexi bacterium]|nr:SH3 domain-containing protein [Chloroflexota bacterium]
MLKMYELLWFLSSAVLICILAAPNVVVGAQAQRTSTPITVRLVTATPPGVEPFPPTVTSLPTATSPGPTFLQAPETAGNINVRAGPDLESEVLGTISFGAIYPALRRYFQWYELRYEPSPSGRAWVYGELVEVTGDLDNIQVVDDFADISIVPDGNSNLEADDGGAAAVAGGDSRVLVISTEDGAARRSVTERRASPLPTFTRPPDLPSTIPTGDIDQPTHDEAGINSDRRSEFPPFFPIVMLAGFGLVGLLINLIRH